jgi:hypothetical protein
MQDGSYFKLAIAAWLKKDAKADQGMATTLSDLDCNCSGKTAVVVLY